jgi:hypothetical protein
MAHGHKVEGRIFEEKLGIGGEQAVEFRSAKKTQERHGEDTQICKVNRK